MIRTKIDHIHAVQPASRKFLYYWITRTGTTVPQLMQAPQNTGYAAGIWQNCGVWRRGTKDEERSGGGWAERGDVVGHCGRGWEDGWFASVWRFLSVKLLDSLDGTPSLEQFTSSFSSFTAGVSTSSLFSSFLISASILPGFRIGEDLASVFWLLRLLIHSMKSYDQ